MCLTIALNSIAVHAVESLWTDEQCSNGANLKYLSGDALRESLNCVGPNNAPYPR